LGSARATCAPRHAARARSALPTRCASRPRADSRLARWLPQRADRLRGPAPWGRAAAQTPSAVRRCAWTVNVWTLAAPTLIARPRTSARWASFPVPTGRPSCARSLPAAKRRLDRVQHRRTAQAGSAPGRGPSTALVDAARPSNARARGRRAATPPWALAARTPSCRSAPRPRRAARPSAHRARRAVTVRAPTASVTRRPALPAAAATPTAAIRSFAVVPSSFHRGPAHYFAWPSDGANAHAKSVPIAPAATSPSRLCGRQLHVPSGFFTRTWK
jgi:hypothetical protein